MESPTKTDLTFKVTRRSPELIPPARPTPHEFKPLSDIDDQTGLRFLVPIIQFYGRNPSMDGIDPVAVIRSAVARALVQYYPLAGRLREHADQKLVVECTGEGVLFIEADADVTLRQFGQNLHPPFPCVDELLYDVSGSDGIVGCPLILIQVTRLICGGFIFALRFNHTIWDGTGLEQFLSAVAELARGATDPSVPPVWQRHLLSARDTPRVSRAHREYDEVPDTKGTLVPHDDAVERSFLFGAPEISALRSRLPHHLRGCTTFDILTACIWRCRTIAISPDPEEEVRMIFTVDSRKRFNPPLPKGYYGNAFAIPAAIAAAGELSKKPLHYAVELIRKSKLDVTEEYMRSVADLMVVRGRPRTTLVRSFIVSDLSRMGLEEVDYGWGKAAFGGVAKCGAGVVIPELLCFYTPWKNGKGDSGIIVPMSLAAGAMEVFMKELQMMLKMDDKELPLILPSSKL